MSSHDTSRISPTALLTAQVWYHHGLSHPALRTRTGEVFYRCVRPLGQAYERLGHRNLETVLLLRHQAIDRLLARAIDGGEVSQVVEIAAGLSPRGFRFAQRYGDAGLVYIESDLPAIAARKRRVLDAAGLRGPGHHVVDLDALAPTGPASLDAATAALLDPGRGTAIITEGLVLYLDESMQQDMWRRFARFLGGFPRGLYLSDLYLMDDIGSGRLTALLARLVERMVRGRLHLSPLGAREAERTLAHAGFGQVTSYHPADLDLDQDPLARQRRPVVRVVAARTA